VAASADLSALQGHAESKWNLGLSYNPGMGVSPDYAEAVHPYGLAAEQEVAGAQYNLGAMYRHERGVAKDNNEAHRHQTLLVCTVRAIGEFSAAYIGRNF
jgi:TPR repeat protein